MSYKDLSDRYAGSVVGILWALLYPLFLVGIYVLVFTFIFQVKLPDSTNPLEYSLFAIVGLTAWITAQEGIVRATNSIVSNSSLVKQVIFPIDILPINTILISFITLIIGFGLYIGLATTFLPNRITLLALLLPLVIIFHFLFAVGLGWILSAIAVYFRDLREVVTILLFIGMFVTPVLYNDSMIPTGLYWPIQINPMTHLINMYRDVIFYGKIDHPWSFLIFATLSILLFFLGSYFFGKIKTYFANFL